MARKRPTASDVAPPALTVLDGGRPDGEPPRLTRAEARALLRSSPLTHADLERHFAGFADDPLQSA